MLSDAQFCIDWVKQMGEFTPLTAPNVDAYIRKREEALRAQADALPEVWRAVGDGLPAERDAILVTNNLATCESRGGATNMWLVGGIYKSGDSYEAFTDAGRRIENISHWRYALTSHPAPEAVQAGLSDDVRQLLENAASCIMQTVLYEQESFDSPPQPSTEWDYNAEQLARDILAILTRAARVATEAQEAIAQLNRERAVDPAKLNMPLDAALRSAATVAEPVEDERSAVDPMTQALPFAIFADEMKALRRFHECVTDDEGYDVPKDMMKRLSEIGLVRRVTSNIYEHTDFGLALLNGDFATQSGQRASVAEDAARYRWLRTASGPQLRDAGCLRSDNVPISGDELDAAIDAAMLAAAPTPAAQGGEG